MTTMQTEKEENVTITIGTTTKEEVKENDHATLCEENSPTIKKSLEVSPTTTSSSSPIEKNTYNKKKWWQFWKQDEQLMTIDPQDFTKTQKNLILLTIALATLVAPISTTIYTPALVTIQEAFNTNDTKMNATLSAFTFTAAVFPLIWSAIGEVYGRRPVYLVSFLIYVIGCVCCTLSVNIDMFIAFRVITAIGSSSVLSMGSGTLVDIYKPTERGTAYSIYASGPLLGPALGPIIGGYLNISLGWRSTLAFVAIYGFIIWLFILFFLPETSRPKPALPGQEPVKPKFRNPFIALTCFRYANVILVALYSGLAFFMYYLVNTTFSRTLAIQYHMDTGTIGLCYLPLAFGAMIGNQIGGRFSDYIFKKNSEAAKNNGQEVYPEMRISSVIIAISTISTSLGFIAYGWCIEEQVHYAYALICIFFLAIGLMIPTLTTATYMMDSFKSRASAVTACISCSRYVFGGVGALVSSDLIRALHGNGITFSIGGGIVLLFSSTIYYAKYNPKKWAAQRAKHEHQ